MSLDVSGVLWTPGPTARTAHSPQSGGRWIERPGGSVVAGLRRQGARGVRIYERGECRVIVAREPSESGPLRWHLSISYPDRYPTWDEIADARYDLLPDELTMAMLLPPRGEYVNRHPFCFHLHELLEGS